jgi:hypothetical protein
MPTQVVFYSSIPLRERQDLSDFAFVMWAPIILIGLAIASVAFGVATTVDPAIFAAP